MTKKFVIIGGTGRLGHMLKYAAPPSTQLLWQSRSSKNSDIEWHFDGNIEASAEKIAPHIENAQAVLCLAGLTHTSSATSELTQAAYGVTFVFAKGLLVKRRSTPARRILSRSIRLSRRNKSKHL